MREVRASGTGLLVVAQFPFLIGTKVPTENNPTMPELENIAL